MKLENEFTVAAPLEKTWQTLLDIPRVAGCLPGATLDSDGADGVFRGRMRMKLGPMTLGYEGTVQMAEVEEDEHSATIEARAKEVKGQGSASARIRNQLRGGDGVTHVMVETDLSITGRPAQFGRGIMEDVATRMITDFARRLEQEISRQPTDGVTTADPAPLTGATPPSTSETPPEPEPSASAPRPAAPDREEPAALDLGNVIAGPIAKRGAVGVGVLALLLAVLLLGRRRPRGLTVTVSYR